MLRQVSSRNQRGKGFRVKHVIQMSLLLVVSIWLLYQIKRSHDKKGTYEERNLKSSLKLDESQANIFKFGRKDLPHILEADSVSESRVEEKENGKVGVKQENGHEETEDGGGRGGNNKTDKQDQEKVAEEADHGKEVANEGKNKDKNGQVEELGWLEDQEHEEVSHEAREKSFRGDDASSAVVDDTQAIGLEERSHVAQEMSFKGDDASSAASQGARVAENEGGSYEEREQSFQGDDASSVVEHNTKVTAFKSENGGSGGTNEKQLAKMERKEIENQTAANGTIDGLKENDSSAAGLDVSKTDDSSVILKYSEIPPKDNLIINGNAVEKRESDVGVSPKREDGSFSNPTPGKSNNRMEQLADLPTVNAVANQAKVHIISMSNEMELPANSTTILNHKTEPQMNSTSAPNDQLENETNMMVIDTETNSVPQQNESTILDSVQDRNATVNMVTPGENKSNLESTMTEQTQNSSTTVRAEESGGGSMASSAANENGETVFAGSGTSFHDVVTQGSGDSHTDQSTLQDIQTKVKSGGEDVAE